MNSVSDEEFLKKYRIEFPEPSTLAVIHAEPVSLFPMVGYSFSDTARDLIHDLIVERGQSVDQFLKSVASDKTAPLHTIIFFLDGTYNMAGHIPSIRSSVDEIAMLSCTTRPSTSLEVIPPTGALFVADVPTLAKLGQSSPFLGQLLQIADGPPDDTIWAYFLGKAESVEEEVAEGIENPLDTFEPVTE